MASQITSFTIVYSAVYSDADKRTHQSSASLAFVHKWAVTRKMLPFDDVIMGNKSIVTSPTVPETGHHRLTQQIGELPVLFLLG